MVSKKTLLAALPPFRNELAMVVYEQSTDDIVDEIFEVHKEYETDYDAISQYFDTGNVYETCKLLWYFLKTELYYDIEDENEQTLRSPRAILEGKFKVDCKHYSLFAGGILDSIKNTGSQNINWCYRFSGYNGDSIEHVFVVVNPGTDQEIWIDPVLDMFDYHKKPTYAVDDHFYNDEMKGNGTVGALYRISGVDDSPVVADIEVDKPVAVAAFITMVQRNVFGLRDLINSRPDILNNQIKRYLSPVDFKILQNVL